MTKEDGNRPQEKIAKKVAEKAAEKLIVAGAAYVSGGTGAAAAEVAIRKVKQWKWVRGAAPKAPWLVVVLVGLACCALLFPLLLTGGLLMVLSPPFMGMQGWESGAPSSYAVAGIPGEFLPIFLEAQDRYGVSWAVLAALAKVESDYGQNMGPSKAGAVGFMQFMPATWDKYKQDGNADGVMDPYDPWDAVFAAANMLRANGFKENPQGAIYQYNHAHWYVSKVLELAEKFSPEQLPGSTAQCLPVPSASYVVSCPFDPRTDPFTKTAAFHHGLDIACAEGTPVFATDDGEVVSAGWSLVFGRNIVLKHDGYTTLYAHLEQMAVHVGQKIRAGEIIGLSGSTGRSTGPHLHFGVAVNGEWCNPEAYLASRYNRG